MDAVTLKEARQSAGLTQEALEALSGVDQTTISRLEREADANPLPDTITRLAKALKVAPSRLRFQVPQPEATVDPVSDRGGQAS